MIQTRCLSFTDWHRQIVNNSFFHAADESTVAAKIQLDLASDQVLQCIIKPKRPGWGWMPLFVSGSRSGGLLAVIMEENGVCV